MGENLIPISSAISVQAWIPEKRKDRSMKILPKVLLSIICLSLLLALGCTSPTKIGKILENTSEYEGKNLTVKGTVSNVTWISLVEQGIYKLTDNSGSIFVFTKQPPPEEGKTISVEGTVKSAFVVFSQSYGTVLVEKAKD
jgi:hypothetical protein